VCRYSFLDPARQLAIAAVEAGGLKVIETKVVGLDVAKNLFQVHELIVEVDRRGETVLRERLRRCQVVLPTPNAVWVGIEANAGCALPGRVLIRPPLLNGGH
jgi:hypothetical protein